MKSIKVTINNEGYELSSLYLGQIKKLNKELSEAKTADDINKTVEKFVLISLRIEHPELKDSFLEDNIYLYELEELFKKLMEVSSVKPSDEEGK